MIGLCFEAETTCSSCGKPLPINALVETIVCTQCMKENTFTLKDWKNLLEDMFKEGPTYAENEGKTSNQFGQRNYQITYGRQNPKFSDTKTYMDTGEIMKCAASGNIINHATNVAYSIRSVPEMFKEVCPNVKYLLCEDFTQLHNYSGTSEVIDTSAQGGLIPFACPKCAGTLQIDGSERMLKCQFCGTDSYIPDETWQKLHPVKTKQRFYFWFDENSMVFDWDSDLWDLVADAEGNLYMSVDPISGSDDKLWIVALKPDLTIKWKRNDLKFMTHTIGGEAKLCLTSNGELVVWSGDRNTILMLSAADGSEIKHLGNKCEEAEKESFTVMDFAKCRYLAADIDGNYFALINRDRHDSDAGGYCEFMRIDKDANLHMPWGQEESQGKGFFGSLKKAFSGMGAAPYFDHIKDKVYRCRDFDTKISIGLDGSYYLLNYSQVAKYDRSGKQIYLKETTKGSIPYKIVGDQQGNAYYIFKQDENEKCLLMKISPDGSNFTTIINNVLDGGGLCKEDMLALSANGTFYCAGYGGRLRTFSPDGKLIYASSSSLEEENEEKNRGEGHGRLIAFPKSRI